jgi:hypothetical protein
MLQSLRIMGTADESLSKEAAMMVCLWNAASDAERGRVILSASGR